MKRKLFHAAALSVCLLTCQMTGVLLPVQYSQASGEIYVSSPDSANPWILDEDGVLTISGTGTMSDNSWIEELGRERIALIRKVEISEGITGIGESYFQGVHFSDLESLTLPESLTVIGKYAFNNCFGLKELIIPANTVLAESYSLSYCIDLERITFLNPQCIIESDVPGVICGYEGSTAQAYAQKNYTSFIDIETGEQTDYVEEVIPPAYSGVCGNDLTWDFQDNGTLTITGTGEMWDFSYAEKKCPWQHLNSDIKRVVLGRGVTSIGNNAFSYLSKMADITIPQGVVRIGNDAFHGSGITTLTLPRSVEYIGKNTFDNAQSLAYVKFLNPLCQIEEEQGYPYIRIIYGYEGSTAQALADSWSCNFISLGEYMEEAPLILGDANDDGEFNISDVVLLQRWLLAAPDTQLDNFMAADLCFDERLDVFDLIIMKSYLVGN